MKVLYLDDERDILELAELFFLEHGLSIDTTVSPRKALAMAAEKSYDVILSDARMPEMDGLEFYALLRNELGYKGRFLLVSGHYDSSDRTSMPKGVYGVVMKPVELDKLYHMIKSLV